MDISANLLMFLFEKLLPYSEEGVQLEISLKKKTLLLPATAENISQLMDKSGVIKVDKKKFKVKDIKYVDVSSPTDFDYAGSLVRTKDLYMRNSNTPCKIDKAVKGDKIFYISHDGNQYLSKSLKEMKETATHVFDAGLFEDNQEKRFNCLFYIDGSLKAKSFNIRSGYYNTPYPLVKEGAKVLWVGLESQVEIMFKNGHSKVIDFEKDHAIKSFAAQGKQILGKIVSDLSNYDCIIPLTKAKKSKSSDVKTGASRKDKPEKTKDKAKTKDKKAKSNKVKANKKKK